MVQFLSGLDLLDYCKKILEDPKFDIIMDGIKISYGIYNTMQISWIRQGAHFEFVVKSETIPNISRSLFVRLLEELEDIKPAKYFTISYYTVGLKQLIMRYDIWVLADLVFKKYENMFVEVSKEFEKIINYILEGASKYREYFDQGYTYIKIIFDKTNNLVRVGFIDIVGDIYKIKNAEPFEERIFSLDSKLFIKFKAALYHSLKKYQSLVLIEDSIKREAYIFPIRLTELIWTGE